MSALSYVLAQPQHDAPERIAYMRCWTAIGPAQTHHLDEAQRFPSEQAAMNHPAFTFWMTFYEPCPIVGDIVGRPLHWLSDEMEAARQELLSRESASDGVRVFA